MSERVTIKVDHDVLRMPTIALRGLVVFPNNVVHFEVGRPKSVAAVEWAMNNTNAVFLTAQREMDTEEPGMGDLYPIGVVAEVRQVLRVSDDLVKVLVEGKYRACLTALDTEEDFLQATVKPAPVRGLNDCNEIEVDAVMRSIREAFEEYLSLSPRLAKDVVYNILSCENAAQLCDYLPANLLFRYQDKQSILEEDTLMGRLEHILALLRQIGRASCRERV